MRSSVFRRARVVAAGLAVALFSAVAASYAQAPAAPAAPKPSQAIQKPKPSPERAVPAREVTLPSARSIIDRHIKAIGGREAILAHTSSHATGTMSIAGAGITGVLDIYGAKPDKSLVKISLGGIGDVFEGFDGTNAWSLSPMTGPVLTQGKELAEKKFDADFYSDLHEAGRYLSMKTVEKADFDGRPCYKVSLVKKDGSEDFDYYDVQTGLKAGALGSRESQMGPMSVTQIHSDYKNFGGLLVPTTLKQTAMGVEQVLKLTSVEFDNVPPSTFEPPVQIKALIK